MLSQNNSDEDDEYSFLHADKKNSEDDFVEDNDTLNFNEVDNLNNTNDDIVEIMENNEENIVDVNEKAELALFAKKLVDIKPNEEAGKALLDLIETLPKINSLLGKVFKRYDVDNNYYTYFNIIHDRSFFKLNWCLRKIEYFLIWQRFVNQIQHKQKYRID